MYTVMILCAMSGRRFRRSHTLMPLMMSSKKRDDESTATATANIGTMARSVV
jgi:hypothetical protein